VQAQAAQQAVLDAQAQKQVEAQSGIEQRAAKKREELATLEAARDELLKSNVSPVKLSALDDQVDERRRELQAIHDEHKRLNTQVNAQPSAGSEVERLARTVATLRERRIALQRKLHSRQVVAAQGGIVTQVLPALGDVVDSGAPVVRIVPDDPTLRLIAQFDARDANDLRVAKHAILTLGADEMVVGAQVVRVHGHEVELKLDDAASVPELDRQLQRDAHLSAEFERERSLLALAVDRLRARRRH
jgi:multidrug resistance efflux pump